MRRENAQLENCQSKPKSQMRTRSRLATPGKLLLSASTSAENCVNLVPYTLEKNPPTSSKIEGAGARAEKVYLGGLFPSIEISIQKDYGPQGMCQLGLDALRVVINLRGVL